MAVDELIDGHVSSAQCKRAVDALLKHALEVEKENEEKELLSGKEQHIWLVLGVKHMHPEKKLKPFRMCAFDFFLCSNFHS
jgi:ribosome biogenesis protein UTP30